jgi:hypothetical protein
VAENARASAEDDAGTDVGVLSEANLTAQDRSVLYDAGAGDSRLRGDDDVAPNHAVVRDVHQVVDLGARADACLAQRAAVDG